VRWRRQRRRFAGALVSGTAAGQTTLEIIGGGTAALNADSTHATVQLDAATNLTLSTMGFITAVGEVAGNSITAEVAGQTLEGLGKGDTLTGCSGFGDTFEGLAAGLNGDIIKGFGGTDVIDVTNLATSATLGYSGNAGQGVLTFNDGSHSGSITMVGDYTLSNFHIATDHHSGSFITYT
jgi:hypothetical protein